MVKSLIKKENQFVFVILNAGLAGGILGTVIQSSMLSTAPAMTKISVFLGYFIIVGFILGISTKYYTKMK
jgi:hypothetical protein